MSNKSIQFKGISGNKYYVHPYYPIGAIYLSVNNTNPSKWFGGTWELIAQGRTLVGVDTTQTEFNTVKKTGGEKTHVLTVAELASHTHTFTGSSHTHSVGAHSHGLNSHTHSFSATTSTKSLTGTMNNMAGQSSDTGVSGSGIVSLRNTTGDKRPYAEKSDTCTSTKGDCLNIDASHNHTVSGTTGAASGSTANSSAFNTGGATQGGTNANTGSGTAHNNLQPYFTCYIWCRTS